MGRSHWHPAYLYVVDHGSRSCLGPDLVMTIALAWLGDQYTQPPETQNIHCMTSLQCTTSSLTACSSSLHTSIYPCHYHPSKPSPSGLTSSCTQQKPTQLPSIIMPTLPTPNINQQHCTHISTHIPVVDLTAPENLTNEPEQHQPQYNGHTSLPNHQVPQ